MTLFDVVISACCIGLAALCMSQSVKLDMAQKEAVALKAQYGKMDCVQVKEYEAQ